MVSLAVRHTELSDQSPQKTANDDCYLVDPELKLFIVCDGVSGHSGGSVASRLAAETVVAEVRKAVQAKIPGTIQDAAKILQTAVQTASKTVFEKGKADPSLAAMATTLDAVWPYGNRLLTAHAGDGRVFLVREGRGVRLTKDHTHVQLLVERGEMTPEEAEVSPIANRLASAVGHQETVRVDLLAPEIQAGDVVLLCTDGIHGKHRGDAWVAEHLKQPGGRAKEILNLMLQKARSLGSVDDATAMILEIDEGSKATASAPTPVIPSSAGPTPPPLSPAAKVRALDLSSCFGNLSFLEKTKLLELSTIRQLAPGEVLAKEGEIAEHLWVLVSGKVRISEAGEDLTEIPAPITLGEAALMEQERRTATITAIEPCSVIEFQRAKLLVYLDASMNGPGAQIYKSIAGIEYARRKRLSAQVAKLLHEKKE